jgi:hypothetical protein
LQHVENNKRELSRQRGGIAVERLEERERKKEEEAGDVVGGKRKRTGKLKLWEKREREVVQGEAAAPRAMVACTPWSRSITFLGVSCLILLLLLICTRVPPHHAVRIDNTYA